MDPKEKDKKRPANYRIKNVVELLGSIIELRQEGTLEIQNLGITFSDSPTTSDPWALSHYLMYIGTFNEDFGESRLASPDDYDYFLFRFLRGFDRPSRQKNRPRIEKISLNSPLTMVVDFLTADMANYFVIATFVHALLQARRENKDSQQMSFVQSAPLIQQLLEGSDSLEELEDSVPMVNEIIGGNQKSRRFAAMIWERRSRDLLNAPIVQPTKIWRAD